MENSRLRYILLGNLTIKKEFGDYPSKSSDQVYFFKFKYAKEAKQIFSQLCKTNYNKYEERQQIDSTNGNFYFSSTQSGDFFIAFVDKAYSERYVYTLFESIQKEGIFNKLEKSGELTQESSQLLRNLFEKYEDLKKQNSIHSANIEIQDVKLVMGKNIQGMLSNLDSLNVY